MCLCGGGSGLGEGSDGGATGSGDAGIAHLPVRPVVLGKDGIIRVHCPIGYQHDGLATHTTSARLVELKDIHTPKNTFKVTCQIYYTAITVVCLKT